MRHLITFGNNFYRSIFVRSCDKNLTTKLCIPSERNECPSTLEQRRTFASDLTLIWRYNATQCQQELLRASRGYYRLDTNDNSGLSPYRLRNAYLAPIISILWLFSRACAPQVRQCFVPMLVHRTLAEYWYGIRFTANYYCHLDKERA